MSETINTAGDHSKSLLIIAHTPSPNTREMAKAVLEGAQNEVIGQVKSKLVSPFDCDHKMVLESDGLILLTTENFGYMSGALKDLFDRVYYPCLAEPTLNDAKPFALIIKAGLDGTGTQASVTKITSGLKWRQVQAATLCKGEFESSFLDKCRHLGLTIAASLDAGII